MFIRISCHLSFRFSCHIFTLWLSDIYIVKFFYIQFETISFLLVSFTLSWQFTTLMTGIQGQRFNSNLSQINKLIFYFLLNHLSFHPNGFSSRLLRPIPPNARLMAFLVERISLHVLTTLVMPLLVKDKVCASTYSVTSVFHVFFVGPTNELMTDKGIEKGRYFHLLQ